MRTIAPAKINWTLEVLGRREDGYHEIRSVMQTIELCDELSVERSEMSVFETVDGERLADDDLVVQAARALEERVGRALPARIRLEKLIPTASGLGGGSSDAAGVIRGLDRLWGLGWDNKRRAEGAAKIGSDVTFFLFGGTALAEGRGERVTPLPDAPTAWLVLLVPPMKLRDKSKRMYEAITGEDFGDGARTHELSRSLRRGLAVREKGLCNAFERVAYRVCDGLERYRDALMAAGAEAAHLAGAGPGLFTLAESEAKAKGLAERVQAREGKVFVTRTLSAQEATEVTD